MEYIQLRVARQILNFGVRDIAKVLRVSKATISKAELGKTRYFLHKQGPALLDFFKLHNIIFPNEYYIRYCVDNTVKRETQPHNTLTRFQLRAARCIMNLTQHELSKYIHIHEGIIARAERFKNTDYIKPQDNSIILKLRFFFSKHNIIFPDYTSVFYKKYIDNNLNA